MDHPIYVARGTKLVGKSLLSGAKVRLADGRVLYLSVRQLLNHIVEGGISMQEATDAGYRLPYRPQAEAPHGWADAVPGVDDLGRPCAVILPLPAPPPPSLEEVREVALEAVAEERNRRVDLYAGADDRARDNRLMVSVAILDRLQRGAETAEDAAIMDALRQVEPLVRAHDAAASAIRADIAAATSTAALEAIIAGLRTDPRWPT